MNSYSIDEKSFCKICSDVIKLSTSPKLKPSTQKYFGEYAAMDKKSILLGRIMRETFFQDSIYKNLESYLYTQTVKELLYNDLGFYLGNFWIFRPRKEDSIYPHIHHFEKSIKLPDGRHLGGREAGRLVNLIELLDYNGGKSIRERIKNLSEYFEKKGEKLVSPSVECQPGDILNACYAIAESIQKITREGLDNKQIDDRLMKRIRNWMLPEVVEDRLREEIEAEEVLKDELDCVTTIKRWFITVILSELFDLEMIPSKLPEKYRKTTPFGKIAKSEFEKENSCVLIKDGEASLSLCIDKLNELKSHNIFIIEEDFKSFLIGQKILHGDSGKLEPTERWHRMVRWAEKVFKNEEDNYWPLLVNKPWSLLKNSRIKELNRESAIEENIRILMEVADEKWIDSNFFRVSGSIWQEKFRRVSTDPLNILFFEITEPTDQILCNFIGLFDFNMNEITEDAHREISEKIQKARIFFTLVGQVGIKIELEKSITEEKENAARASEAENIMGAMAHSLKKPAVFIKGRIDDHFEGIEIDWEQVKHEAKEVFSVVELFEIARSGKEGIQKELVVTSIRDFLKEFIIKQDAFVRGYACYSHQEKEKAEEKGLVPYIAALIDWTSLQIIDDVFYDKELKSNAYNSKIKHHPAISSIVFGEMLVNTYKRLPKRSTLENASQKDFLKIQFKVEDHLLIEFIQKYTNIDLAVNYKERWRRIRDREPLEEWPEERGLLLIYNLLCVCLEWECNVIVHKDKIKSIFQIKIPLLREVEYD